MKIAVAREIDPAEPRVAASPDTVKKFKALGFEVAVEPGAGVSTWKSFSLTQYSAQRASIAPGS